MDQFTLLVRSRIKKRNAWEEFLERRQGNGKAKRKANKAQGAILEELKCIDSFLGPVSVP